MKTHCSDYLQERTATIKSSLTPVMTYKEPMPALLTSIFITQLMTLMMKTWKTDKNKRTTKTAKMKAIKGM